jgi:hypothetical protein
MAPKISAPVGLRNRTTNVANKSADQAVVIDLLAKIADKCGGKGTSWGSRPSPGADGTCPKALADAIWDFQTTWHARGLFHTIDGVVDPGGHSIAQMISMTQGVCGPKVDEQFKTVLTRIQTDFGTWNDNQKNQACTQLLVPLQPATSGKAPTFKDIAQNPTKLLTLAGIKPDINGWDVLPLFQGHAGWLRSQRVLSKSCAVPSSPKPTAGAFDAAHEDPCTCSDSVQIGGKCWLAGTVNYGTFGVMARLCADEFVNAGFRGLVRMWAEGLIKGYKQFISKEDPTLPIAWLEATFNSGPSATPSVPGNRPDCKCSCSLDGSIVTWDYVWEPVKPRGTAATPTIFDIDVSTR